MIARLLGSIPTLPPAFGNQWSPSLCGGLATADSTILKRSLTTGVPSQIEVRQEPAPHNFTQESTTLSFADMNRRILRITLALGIVLLSTSPAEAAKGQKQGNGERRSARVLSRLDANNDGSLDSTEALRVRALFDTLKALDTDHDGKLSDTEIAAAKVAPKKGKRAGRRVQKNA